MRLTFGENGDQHVRARHLFPARRLNMEGRSLYDPLEAVGRLSLFLAVDDEVLKLRIEIMDDGLAQRVEVDAASSQHCGRVDVVDQRQQQMLQRRILMTPFIGDDSARRRVFSSAREKMASGLSLLFHDALKRVLVLAGVIHHLRHFRFRDLVGVHAAFANASVVHLEHDLSRLLRVLVEEGL